jgi:hypothetical protein
MGMLTDYELTATCLAGGLGATRERLERTLGRLIRPSPPEERFWDDAPAGASPNPLDFAVLAQALRELTDIWQGFFYRPERFKEIERLLSNLKDNVLDGFGSNPKVLLNYHRLAQHLNDLKLNGIEENSKAY